MTKITCSGRGDRYYLSAVGHAGYNPGQDIVCAGVSAILESLSIYLDNCGDHARNTHQKREPGRFVLRCSGDEAVGEAWKMACLGLLSIAEIYPSHVSVQFDLEGM